MRMGKTVRGRRYCRLAMQRNTECSGEAAGDGSLFYVAPVTTERHLELLKWDKTTGKHTLLDLEVQENPNYGCGLRVHCTES